MNVIIQGAVQALGYLEDGRYHREPDCYETIRDLIRYLREDGDDHTARIECGRHNLIEHDLVPMVKCDDLSDDEFDIAIRLMVNLCQPAIATMRGKAPTDRDQWKMYWELEENLRRAKTAFTDAHFFVAIKKRIDNYFMTDFDDRDERLRLVVERIVLLVKYVFSINQDTTEGRRTRIEDSSHDRIILAFLQSGIDKTLMHIANQPREKEFHVTILDIFALILKEQCPENLSKEDTSEVSTTEKKKTEEEFRKIIENHVVKETQKRKSFSRFGGSYTIQGLKGIASNSNQVVFKPIQNVEKHNFLDERKTKKRIARNRRPFEIESNTHLASNEVRMMLRDMVVRLIETCFNRLIKSAKSTVFVQGHVLQKTSQINYFFMIKFVLKFVRMSRQTSLFERISECTGVEAFHENNVQLTEYVENATTLKGVEAKSFGLKAQYALGAYNELVLIHRHILEYGKEEGEKKRARRALEHIVNVEEYRELPIAIMKKFSSAVLSNNFLRELVLTTHHYMRLVERFVKTGALKKVTKKVKVRKNPPKKRTYEDERVEFDQMTSESLEALWQESRETLQKYLAKELPEIEDMNPQQLDVDSESHVKFAKLSIQRSLRSRGFAAAIGLFHASQKLWPEEFGSSESAEDVPDAELQMLHKILKADLRKVARELKKAEALQKHQEECPYEVVDKMTSEDLDVFWQDVKSRIPEILELDPEDVNPLNWQLEVTPEVQQQFAMLSIQRALRSDDVTKAIGLYHASRKLWPEDNIFGYKGITVEEEIQELEGILKADLDDVKKEMKKAEDVVKLNDVDGDVLENDENSEDEEETPSWKVEEIDFQFDLYLSKFANVDVLKWYVFLLNDFSKNQQELNQALVKMLHRIAFDLKLPVKLYQVSLFQVFQKVNEHFSHLTKELRKSSPLFELYQFGFHLLKKFFQKYSEMGEELAVETLFWKGPRECFEIENGYGTWIKNKEADVKVWTEEMETELRNLYDEFKTVQSEDGIDVLDFIEHNLSRARSRKQIAKKLIEFGLDLLGAKWKNLGKASEMDTVLPIGDIQKWTDEWRETGKEGDLVEILRTRLNETIGNDVSRKRIIKQLAHMDIHYEKPKKERPLPEWDAGLIDELRGLKEQYEEIDDAENLLGVDMVRYVIKRLSEKKPSRQVERHLIAMGAKIQEMAQKPKRKSKKAEEKSTFTSKEFVVDDDSDSDEDVVAAQKNPDSDEDEGVASEPETPKKKILESDDDEKREKSAEKAPKSPPKNTLMSRIANKKRKFAQLESDSDSDDSSDNDEEAKDEEDVVKKKKVVVDDSDSDDAEIFKRSYTHSLLTSGSVAGGQMSRETSEEKDDVREVEDDDEDPFTKKIKFKRRIVMSDNEDDED